MHDQDRQSKRSEILDRLRAHFGEERTGEFVDLDGLGLLSTFLRRIPGEDDEEGPSDRPDSDLSREDVRLIRRRRHDKPTPESAGEQEEEAITAAAGQEGQAAAAEAMTFGALVEEIPRMRENLAEWIGGVDADYLPSSSNREELEALLNKAAYRLKVLKVMVNETQKELEALTLAMRAGEATGTTAD